MSCSAHPLSDDPCYMLTEQQKAANIRYIKTWIASIDRDHAEELAAMGLLTEPTPGVQEGFIFPPGTPMRSHCRIKNLNHAHWHLAKLYRHSVPRRMAEAVPSLEWLMNFQRLYMDQEFARKDLTTAAYLAVALSDSRRYPEAQAAFELVETSIANNPDHELDASFLLWLRSNHAKTFDCENVIVQILLQTPQKWSPSALVPKILGPGDDPETHPIWRRLPWIKVCTELTMESDVKPWTAYDIKGRPYPIPSGIREQMPQIIAHNLRANNNIDAVDLMIMLFRNSGEVTINSRPKLKQVEPEFMVDGVPLLGDPFEINQEDVKECWVARCGKTKDLKMKCHTARYCSREHQVQVWKLHKVNCKAVYREGLAADKQAAPAAPTVSVVDEMD